MFQQHDRANVGTNLTSFALVVFIGLIALAGPARACIPSSKQLGVSRIVEIDTTGGPNYGRATKFNPQPSFLKPGEVVLTFDDGPTPRVTDDVLKALSEHCTRATFFPVGKRALAFPDLIRRIERSGHTIGGHTWSHPNNLTRLKGGKARDEIERGFAAVALSAERAIAPFFRFPGLNDNRDLLAYTQSRKLGVFSVDVISNDSYARSVRELVRTTRRRTRANKGGILLFHDLRSRTAAAIPYILRNLKTDGFEVVHITSATPFVRDKGYDSVLKPEIDKALARRASKPGLPEPSSPVPLGLTVPVTTLAPSQAPFDGHGKRRHSSPARTGGTSNRKTTAEPKSGVPAASTSPKIDASTVAEAERRATAASVTARPASEPTPERARKGPRQKPADWRTTIGPAFGGQ